MRLIGALLFRILIALLPGSWLRWLLTQLFPLKLITGRSDNDPYLYRWTFHKRPDGGHLYIHYFARGDDDEALHSHPASGHSTIVAWGYQEERRVPMRKTGDPVPMEYWWDCTWRDALLKRNRAVEAGKRTGYIVLSRKFRFLDENRLEADTFHRVDLLYPKKGCWTLFELEPREQPWSFWDRNTGETLPHREFIAQRKSQ